MENTNTRERDETEPAAPPARLALCMECMNWWNAGTGKLQSELSCPDDRATPRSHPVALYFLHNPQALREAR